VEEWQSTCGITWKDASGNLHSAKYKVAENSPLFQLYDGQSLTIRYNPKNPDQFYQRDVAKSNMISTLLWKVAAPLLGVAVLAALVAKFFLNASGQ
jgi:hypothetical protein